MLVQDWKSDSQKPNRDFPFYLIQTEWKVWS